ncbi:putative integral membrane protein [Parathielavia hyrcaniae]|uniref:Integral membrane protein n=1 Tax=Parathielavia hyrcaniae TaxID=113614 RepID=A0AAN6PW23_9PEZI|nr:putative integral membrane protein [Parathielavia hyrcaniae]
MHDDGLAHPDYGPQLNIVFWLLTGLAAVFLALRLYCKIYRGRQLWWDDYFLIAAWASLLVSAATTSVCVSLGYGKNTYDMPAESITTMQLVAVFAGFFSVLAAAWSKTSFALTLLRLCEAWRWLKAAIWFIIITVNAILGAAMLFMWIKCRPFAKIWDSSLEGWCIDPSNIVTLYQWSAGWSGSADIVLALFPWTILFGMLKTLNNKERLGIGIAMSMGIIAGVASFVKMAMLPKLTGEAAETVAVTIWGGAEGATTIMAASIPVLRALIRGDQERYTRSARFNTIDEIQLNGTSLEALTSPRKDSRGREIHFHGA